MSSSALTLVNKVLRMTGDYDPLTTIAGAPANVGERILDFLNLVIEDLENRYNWPILRVNLQATADGTTDVFEWSGTDKVRTDAPISVWITNKGKLVELTATQFDEVLASKLSLTNPLYFQRGESTTGNLQIQIYPKPANGDKINVTAYKLAKRLAGDNDTTEFDDAILVLGAMAHMDAYDGLSRGYGDAYEQMVFNRMAKDMMNREIHREVTSYR